MSKPSLKEAAAVFGAKGGQSRSAAKRAAVVQNLKKARKTRWKKPVDTQNA